MDRDDSGEADLSSRGTTVSQGGARSHVSRRLRLESCRSCRSCPYGSASTTRSRSSPLRLALGRKRPRLRRCCRADGFRPVRTLRGVGAAFGRKLRGAFRAVARVSDGSFADEPAETEESGSAQAVPPPPVKTAAPTPSATASPPTRPIYLDGSTDFPWLGAYMFRELYRSKACREGPTTRLDPLTAIFRAGAWNACEGGCWLEDCRVRAGCVDQIDLLRLFGSRLLTWCPRQDSNLRPSAPEADALSPELRGRMLTTAPIGRR